MPIEYDIDTTVEFTLSLSKDFQNPGLRMAADKSVLPLPSLDFNRLGQRLGSPRKTIAEARNLTFIPSRAGSS
jgi:hypothetical protein